MLNRADPVDGCSKMAAPPSGDGVAWVAVIERSPPDVSCNFIEKVRTAHPGLYGVNALLFVMKG